MTDWGREIIVDGVRPAWLTDADALHVNFKGQGSYTVPSCFVWPGSGATPVWAIRLPADHWAYRALDAGFEPWPGGDNAPDDWDGGDVLWDDGFVGAVPSINQWKRKGIDRQYAHVIGYRRKSEPTLRTSDEALRRMEALVRRMATEMERRGIYDEAREIVKLLPEPPVDPDLLEARRLVADAYHQEGSHTYRETVDGTRDDAEVIEMALAGIRRGRELAAESR